MVKTKKTKIQKETNTDEDTSSDSSILVELVNSDSDLEFYPKTKDFDIEEVDIKNLNNDEFLLTELTSDKLIKKSFLSK